MRKIRIRQLCLTTLGSFVLLIGSQSLFAAEPAQKAQQAAEKAQKQDLYLFVQSATEASLSKNPDASQNDYLLVLKNVHPYISAFSERPERKTQAVDLKKYLSMWTAKGTNNFRQNPPNAALHAVKQNAASNVEPINYFLEINAPQYDAAAKTLTYRVKPLQGNAEPLPETTTSLNHATLFIDDVCLSCW